ncbi:MAG: hypothetical protein ACRDY7_06680 [Acidimicrobiia bacterium]
MRKNVLRVAAPACLGVSLASLAALPGTASAEPAPPGTATASGLIIGDLLGVAQTGAHADSGGAGSGASVLSVGGEPVLGLGGTQESEGETGGALLHVGGDGPAVSVAPWEASSSGPSQPARSAESKAAAARVDVPSLVGLDVVESESKASHRDPKSNGSGFSNGAHAVVADAVDATVLHSEVNSEGEGSSHLVGLNGTEIGTDEQLGSICALDAGVLARLSCLVTGGGAGLPDLTAGSSSVAEADSGVVDTLLGSTPIGAFAVTGGSGSGETALPAAPVDATDPAPVAAPAVTETSRSVGAPADDGNAGDAGITGALARTGATAMDLLPFGLLALGLGAGLQVAAARRRVLA